MGPIVSKDPSSEPDPRSGLSPKDIQIIRDQWKMLVKDYKKIVPEIFISYFKKHPEGQALFHALGGEPESLRTAPQMFAHSSNVTYSLSAMIDNLEEVDVVLGILDRLSNSHFKHKVNSQHMKDMKQTMVDCIVHYLGPEATEEAKSAWMKLLDLIYNFMEDYIDKLSNK